MANRSAWTGGNLNSGLGWTAFFQAADLNSLPNTDSILSSTGDITNGTGLDQFFDVSFVLTIASNTIAAGANLTFWLAYLQEDAATYGDGGLTAGTQAAFTPGFYPKLVIPLRQGAAITTLIGFNNEPLVMPPGTWRPILQNNSGFALSGSGNAGKFRSYNVNLNN